VSHLVSVDHQPIDRTERESQTWYRDTSLIVWSPATSVDYSVVLHRRRHARSIAGTIWQEARGAAEGPCREEAVTQDMLDLVQAAVSKLIPSAVLQAPTTVRIPYHSTYSCILNAHICSSSLMLQIGSQHLCHTHIRAAQTFALPISTRSSIVAAPCNRSQ